MNQKISQRRAVRAARMLLGGLLLAGVMQLAAFAVSGTQSGGKITLRAVTPTGQHLSSRTYTAPQQLERLQDMLPPPSQQLPEKAYEMPAGGVAVEMEIYSSNGNKTEDWSFIGKYAVHQPKNGEVSWFSSSAEKWSLLLFLTGCESDTHNGLENATFNGEKVKGLYTLDTKNHSYNVASAEQILRQLENTPQTKKRSGKTGFLVLTEKKRYTWYYGRTAGNELLDFAQENNRVDSRRRAQWLVYLDPAKIKSMAADGLGGSGYTLGHASKTYDIKIGTTNSESIQRTAAFLKTIPVNPGATREKGVDNPNMPSTLFTITIKFSNGVECKMIGYHDRLSVSASDLEETIYYQIEESRILALRDFLSLLPETQLTEVSW